MCVCVCVFAGSDADANADACMAPCTAAYCNTLQHHDLMVWQKKTRKDRAYAT